MGGLFSFSLDMSSHDIGTREDLPQTYEEAANIIKENWGKVVVITGAGISSHVLPTFRSNDSNGLWDVVGAPVLDKTHFYTNPFTAWKLSSNVRNLQLRKTIFPSPSHRVIHYMLKYGIVPKLITQNIDSLHSFPDDESKIVELHGKVSDFGECETCQAQRIVDHMEVLRTGKCPKCPVCGENLKPTVAFFQDLIPKHLREQADEAVSHANVLILVGTHCAVDPVLKYVQDSIKNGIYVIEINPDTTCISQFVDIRFAEKADDALVAIGHILFPDIDFNEKIPGEAPNF